MTKKRYILAISGGIDSVVLLDMAMQWENVELIVAHFDHGIREESAEDARFVAQLAQEYNLPFEHMCAELGATASEEQARTARYAYLKALANEYEAQLVTAHHADDVIETIIINLLRGTGWRGICSLRSGEVYRPLLDRRKQELRDYAQAHHLVWREDASNQNVQYLRNYVRHHITTRLPEHAQAELLALYTDQCRLLSEITTEITRLEPRFSKSKNEFQRYFLTMAPAAVARELLYAIIVKATGKTTMRPQLARALLSVKTLRAGTTHQVGQGVELRFSRVNVIVEASRN